MSAQTPSEPPEITLKPAEEAAIWPSRKHHRGDIVAAVVAIVLSVLVLSATVPRIIPLDDSPDTIRDADEQREYEPVPSAATPQTEAIAQLDPHDQLDALTRLYLHAACWPEQYPVPPTPLASGETIPCPIPDDQIPRPGPTPRDMVRGDDT